VHPAENRARMAAGIPLTDEDRAPWLATLSARLAAAEKSGAGVVVACSALKRAYRDVLREGAADVQFIHLRGTRSLLHERLANRSGHFMPVALLDSQLDVLEEPGADEGAWVVEIGQPLDAVLMAVLAAAGLTPPSVPLAVPHVD
jgi:gluconokinase